jgi:hypothetical protein
MRLTSMIRTFHRWTSVAFTLAVGACMAVMSQGVPPDWMNFLALPPLFALFLSGLYLFAAPYLAAGRRAPSAD